MPRKMPDLVSDLSAETQKALSLARAGEIIRTRIVGDPTLRNELSAIRLQLIYEMAFLRAFTAWEVFLEESFIRYLCGFQNSAGPLTPITGSFQRSISDARCTLLSGQRYLLWHAPAKIQMRSQRYFEAGPHETVIASNQSRMEWFASVRHYIAHKHDDARVNFDSACMNLCGRRFRGSRPGAFLRDRTIVGGLPLRWLEVISNELVNLAKQIIP